MSNDVSEWSKALKVEFVDDFSHLLRLEPQWQALVEASAQPEPMLAPDWAMTWWKYYRSGRLLAVGIFRKDDEIVGLAPLCRRIFSYRPGIPFRRLELMGSSGDEADGVCGEYLGPIAAAGSEADVARAFSAALAQNLFGPWDELVLELMDGEGAITAPLIEALQALDGGLTCRSTTEAWYLPLPDDWNSFLQTVHGKRRNWFRRTWKDFLAWVGDKGYAVERARTPDDMRTGMRILSELHVERWHEAGHGGAFVSPRFAGFHHEYATRILKRGQLDLLWLTVGGEPVAAHYSFVSGGKVYFYQSGRKMGVPANVRLGIVMFILAIQDAMARGLREYDFLGGDSTYKSLFTTRTRPLVQVRVARPSLRETTRLTLHTAVNAARRLSVSVRHLASRPASTGRATADHGTTCL